MMSQEQNDLITRIGPKDPCGRLMRMYWQPAALVDELQGPRAIRPVKLLGEELVMFRDEQGRYGLIDRHCAHRGADLAFGRLEQGGLALRLPWLAVRRVGPMPADAGGAEGIQSSARASSSAPIRWWRRAASSGPIWAKASRPPFPSSTASSRRTATSSRSRAIGNATGCRRWRSASIPRTPPICTASSRMRTRPPRTPMAASSAARPPAPTCR